MHLRPGLNSTPFCNSPPLWDRRQHMRLVRSRPGFYSQSGQVSWVRFFWGFSSPVRQMSGIFRRCVPEYHLAIIIIHNHSLHGCQWPEMLMRPKTLNIYTYLLQYLRWKWFVHCMGTLSLAVPFVLINRNRLCASTGFHLLPSLHHHPTCNTHFKNNKYNLPKLTSFSTQIQIHIPHIWIKKKTTLNAIYPPCAEPEARNSAVGWHWNTHTHTFYTHTHTYSQFYKLT